LDVAINKTNISDSTLIWAVVCSILLHALLAITLPNFKFEFSKEKPVELTIELEQPKAPEPVAAIQPVQPIEPVKPEVIPPKPIKKIQPKELPKPVAEKAIEPSPVSEEPVTPPSEAVPNVISVAPKTDTVAIASVPAPTPEVAKPVETTPIDDNALGEYGSLLGRAIAKHKQYPRIAQQRGYEGDVMLDLKLDGNGNVLSARIKVGSGYESLDKQALEMVRKASPFPAPPAALRNRTFNITVPVSFKLESN
jgi:periplasmic protein TonB